MPHPPKTLGILGGMGPESTADLFLRVIRATPVERDQDHLRILIDSNPHVPDRTDAILSGDTQPIVDVLTEMARGLERAGADVLAVPCNTAHYFLPKVREAVGVPILDMIDEVCEEIADAALTPVGLLATTGTIAAGLYAGRLEARGIPVLVPDRASQNSAMAVIKEVKAAGVTGTAERSTEGLARELQDRSAAAIIAGCTEFSLVLSKLSLNVPVIDPLDSLTRAALRECGIVG